MSRRPWKKRNNAGLAAEEKWFGGSYGVFLRNIPKKHLLNQLYMFSSGYNFSESSSNVQRLSYYFFTDTFVDGIDSLNRKTGLNLKPVHIRKANYKAHISEQDLSKLRDMLDEEYNFLISIRKLLSA